jgi:copper chaperone
MILQLTVPKLACFACAKTITKAIQSIDSTATVQADPKTKIVSIKTQVPETKIKEIIAAIGYPSV